MKEKRRDFSLSILKVIIPAAPIIDFCVATLLFFTTTLFLKLHLPQAHPFDMREVVLISIVFGSAWVLLAMTDGFYRFRRTRRFFETVGRIFKTTFMAQIVALALYVLLVGLFFEYYKFFHRRFFFLSLGLNFSLFALYQYILTRIYLIMQYLGYNQRNLLIAGINQTGVQLLEKIMENPLWGYTVVGFVDDLPNETKSVSGKKILGGLEDIEKLYLEGIYDRLVVCLSLHSDEQLLEIVRVCEKNNIDVQFVPNLFHFVASRAAVTNLDGMPVMGLYEPPMQGLGGVTKRLIDFTGALLGLILISPLLLLLAILVKLSSPGPIFYGQERVGLDNRPFMMWKFRSMRIDAEVKEGAKWAVRDDPRKTKIGSILRKYSLDELPQLWNVLVGHMSLVGPRPERPVFVDQFKESIHGYMKRHRVKAGMTGWAQVNGLRGSETSLQTRIDYDLYYIENWSFFFDIEILFRTIAVVINDDSAL